MYINVSIAGDKQFISKLTSLGTKLHDFESAYHIIGTILVDFYGSKVFASAGGALGAKWDKLSPVYAKRKAQKYPGRGILVATGAMQQDYVYEASPNLLVISNTAPQFKYHQSTEPRTKIPRRPSLGVNQEVKSIVRTVIKNDINEKIRMA